jgi:Tol biopolymer transport system component
VLVYSVLQQDRNIWRLDLKDESPARWTRVIASPVQDASPQYSPAGDRIVFRSDRSGEEQLWVCGPDGSNPAPVTSGRLRPSVGRWSPDGKMIAFNNAKEALVFVATEGADGRWTTRASGVMGIHPVFSPDGKWIYAGRNETIVRLPAAGGEASDAAARRGISLGMSADGRSLYFMQEPAGTTLWGMDLGSGAIQKVLEGIVPYCSSCWAAAPGGIYYLGIRQADQQAIFFHDLAAGKSRAVVDYPEPLLPIGSGPFSLSPDGRYLLCVRVDPSNSDVSRVEGFR